MGNATNPGRNNHSFKNKHLSSCPGITLDWITKTKQTRNNDPDPQTAPKRFVFINKVQYSVN